MEAYLTKHAKIEETVVLATEDPTKVLGRTRFAPATIFPHIRAMLVTIDLQQSSEHRAIWKVTYTLAPLHNMGLSMEAKEQVTKELPPLDWMKELLQQDLLECDDD